MAISWPAVIKDEGGIRNQFTHLIDIVPTIQRATSRLVMEVHSHTLPITSLPFGGNAERMPALLGNEGEQS
jgi:arylsulfatase A-like enzyme